MKVLLMVYHAKLEMSIVRVATGSSGCDLVNMVYDTCLRTSFGFLDPHAVGRNKVCGHCRPGLCRSGLTT